MGGHDMSNMDGATPFTDPAMMMGMFAGFNRLKGAEYDLAWVDRLGEELPQRLSAAQLLCTRTHLTAN